MKIFISHSSDDKKSIDSLINAFNLSKEPLELFFSSNPEIGILAGEHILDKINLELEKCDYFIAVITNSYVRSLYCIYEFNVAQYLYRKNKISKIVPIFQNINIQKNFSEIIDNHIFIDAPSSASLITLEKTLEPIINIPQYQLKALLENFMHNLTKCKSTRTYIGMDEHEFKSISCFCEENGIISLTNHAPLSTEIKEKSEIADEITIVSTTGASLIKELASDSFVKALVNKTKINVILPNQYSDFCYDVAEIERINNHSEFVENIDRIAKEYSAVIGYLKEAYINAKRESIGQDIGTITCYCSYTLLRQTIYILKKGNLLTGWASMTLPPKRTINKTMTLEVSGHIGSETLSNSLWQHCEAIKELAINRKATFTIDENAMNSPFFLEKQHAINYWKNKYEKAKNNMSLFQDDYRYILIEVAAQHPLHKKNYPGKEFEKRLDFAIHLYKYYKSRNADVNIYVPGSKHKFNGHSDEISLSKAGTNYLHQHGIPMQDIIGDEANNKYKGHDGVYNSADECYVASQLFLINQYDHLICVCSPNQVTRKTLFYIEFGVIPQCYCVPTDNMYHDILDELFYKIYKTIYVDHSWQNKDSQFYINSRIEREP